MRYCVAHAAGVVVSLCVRAQEGGSKSGGERQRHWPVAMPVEKDADLGLEAGCASPARPRGNISRSTSKNATRKPLKYLMDRSKARASPSKPDMAWRATTHLLSQSQIWL